MRPKAVFGLGMGDEGKGKTVSWLCSKAKSPTTIRFSGGHQAGHHVMIDENLSHVFSNFGSGTLQGASTYWSRFCTIDPVGIFNEYQILKEKVDVMPVLYIDHRCPITTPFDKNHNKVTEGLKKHGSCGVGFGETIQREEDRYSLIMEDLFNEAAFFIKLDMIRNHYGREFCSHQESVEFIEACEWLINTIGIIAADNPITPTMYHEPIFEGSQGLLLDQDIGFFPHVTRSNTGYKNMHDIQGAFKPIFVTRAYQTRHGNGPMEIAEGYGEQWIHNPYEQSRDDGPQGVFRSAPLSLDILKYGLRRNDLLSGYDTEDMEPTLVITCLDLVEDKWVLIRNDEKETFKSEGSFVSAIGEFLGFEEIYLSRSPFSADMERYGI